ncbi:acriflavine resistance protein B [Acidobacteria bacterium Mor1]|nr:acriflavine resistance protein B [Acidobacteria bacterium Mor1]
MGITDIFIRRPVLAIVVNLLIIIAGLQAIGSLTVRQYPRNENASITISTVYVGADAELVRGFVTVPLERAIAAADGIDYLQSSSSRGISTITARLELNYDSTKALAEIGSKVDQVRGDLPPEAEVPTINIATADSEFAAAYLSFNSDILQQNEITDYLVRAVQPRLSALPGVQRADVLGARNFAMRIWLKPNRMAAYNISPAEVRAAVEGNNYLGAIGQTKGALIQVNLAANTDLRSVQEFKDLVLRESGGALVRLSDVADVVLGAEDYTTEVRFSGQTATFMGVWVLPNANSIDVIRSVREEIEALQRDLPSGLSASMAYDSTSYINDALAEVVKTLSETLLIVVVVIFLFLGSLRSVLVPVVAIPVSLIGAVFLMQLFGFTINLLTLLAIVLSVGLVVDDAIVMVENIERNLRRGLKPFDAAIAGARELTGPVISITITLAAVYAPIGLQSGLTGSLFREFAFTLAGAVLISGVVALTLSPVMSASLLKVEQGALQKRVSGGFERLRRFYRRLLDASLNARPAMYVLWIGLSLLAVAMYTQSPNELAPTEDQGVVFGILETPSNATLEFTGAASDAANEIFMGTPEAAYTFQLTNPGGGFGGLVLDPWSERDRHVFEVQAELQAQLEKLPSVNLFPITPPPLPGGGQFPVEFVVASTADPERILEVAQQLQLKAIESGMFAFPPILDTKIDQPLTEVVLDRDKISSMGLDLRTVGADLAAMVGGNFVNRFNIDGRSYKVIPQIKRPQRLNPDQLQRIYITGPDGGLISLSAVAELRREVQPRALNRFQQLNAVKISGVAIQPLDATLRFLEDEARALMPQGFVIDYTGESRQLREEGQGFLITIALSVILIYLVLAAQFNSFRDPFVILAGSVPLAMFGALIFTFLKMPNAQMPFWTDGWTTTLNIYSQVGLVTLVGLVSKNGILIVEFANVLQGQGMSKLEAVREAATVRLRPVLMTTVATVLGHFPLVLVSGPGAEARNSIGLVLVSGMAIGTLFTLFVVPSIYVFFARDHRPAVATS